MMHDVTIEHPGLVQWLASGERGLSSNQIVQTLTCVRTERRDWGVSHPEDPDDLHRCRKLLDAVPTLRPLLPRMAAASRVWAALVPAWDELCALMDEEAPEWGKGKGSAPLTYRRMRDLIEDAEAR